MVVGGIVSSFHILQNATQNERVGKPADSALQSQPATVTDAGDPPTETGTVPLAMACATAGGLTGAAA